MHLAHYDSVANNYAHPIWDVSNLLIFLGINST